MMVGFITHQHYGIGWDEPLQRLVGQVNYNYFINNDPAINTFIDKEYGAGIELPLIFFEKWLHLSDTRHIYHMRHLVTHFLFLISGFAGYLLAYRLSRNNFIACLCFVMLVLSPRLYTHSFINSKDIPFLSMITITLAFSHYAFGKGKVIPFLILGALCGYTTAIRVMGILPFVIFLFFIVFDIISNTKNKDVLKRQLLSGTAYVASYIVFTYTFWPYLWAAPVHHFAAAYRRMSHFSWGSMLFNGKVIESGNLPLSYFPTMFSITTPPVWLFTGLLGLIFIIILFIKRPLIVLRSVSERFFIISVIFFVAPIAAVIILKSSIYDDWRHLYFVYPAFVFMAVYFITHVCKGKFQILVKTAIVAQAAGIILFLSNNHPYGQVYFNSLVSHEDEYLRKNFDYDYWGCSFKQGLDFIVNKHKIGPIKFYTMAGIDVPFRNNVLLLPKQERNRIVEVPESDSADYMITSFRGHPQDYDYKKIEYKVKVQNSTIFCIYSLR